MRSCRGTQPSTECTTTPTVSPGQPLRRTLVPPSAGQAFHIGLRHRTQEEVALAGLLQEFRQWQSVSGHGILVGSG
jgi:hypothetical protein